MNSLNKKIWVFVILIVWLSWFPHPYDVSIASPNVQDCLENSEDCEEENFDQDKDSNKENDFLTENNSNDSLLLNVIRMVFALFLVLALIYIAIRFIGKRNNLLNDARSMENLGGISLGPNRSIQIVRVGGKFYLIGVGENVELLEEVTDEQLIESLMKDQEQSTGVIQTILGKKRKNDRTQNKTDFKKLFKTELDQLKQNRQTIINQNKEDRHE